MTVRSLAAADSGISTMQTMIDTIGDNVANANTTGYKATTPQFEDVLTEQLQPASGASGGLSSTNPAAVGAGVQVAAMNTDFSEGSIVQTGVPSDVAIQGNGFFVISSAGQTYYTRDGAFQLDVNGTLETASGAQVLGWAPGKPTTGPTGPLSIPAGLTSPPQETANVTLAGNVDAGAASPVTATSTLYDAQGNTVPLTLTFTPTGSANQWLLQASLAGSNLFATGVVLTFDSSGQLASYSVDGGPTTPVGAGGASVASTRALPAGYQWNESAINFVLPAPSSPAALTQFAQGSTVAVGEQDGYGAGTIESYSIGATGTITGAFTNGQTQQLGTIALATFTNPSGLENNGNLEYQETAASGRPLVGTAGTGGRGTLLGGALEQSNVQLASQLTSLIEAQTDYEADTKVIATTQTVLQALVTNA
ncbi:MAG TPA: flagellar hook protein FlgE [Acidimicrobiales bacterium]|jgi:flagellar hook protein FlgE|nr:flagellar hook protein FlgE [Acidimicrobiales bacterium]